MASPKRTEEAAQSVGPAHSFGRAAVFALVTAASTTGLAIVRSKVSAVVLGPEGMGLLSQLQQVAGLAFVPLSATYGAALVAHAAPALRDRRDAELHAAVWNALNAAAIVSLVSLAATFALGTSTLGGRPPLEFLAVGLATALTAMAAIATQLLSVLNRHDLNTKAAVASGVLGSLLIIAGTVAAGVPGQLLATVGAGVVAIAFGFWAVRSANGALLRPRWRLDREYLTSCATLGLAGLVAAGIEQTIAFVSRWVIADQADAAGVGQFHAAWAIGATYFSVVLSALSMAAYPRMVAASTAAELRATIDEASAFVMRFAPPVVLSAMALRAPVIHALYSDRFDPAISVLGWMIGADLFRAIGWTVAAPLLLRGRVRYFVVVQLTFGAISVCSYLLLVTAAGLDGAGPAYFVSNLLGMWVAAAALHASTPGAVAPRPLLLSTGLGALLLAWQFWDAAWLNVVALGAAIAWAWRSGALSVLANRLRNVRSRFQREDKFSR